MVSLKHDGTDETPEMTVPPVPSVTEQVQNR